MFTVPTGTAVYQAVNTVLSSFLNKSFEWSIINLGVYTFNLSSAAFTGHTIIGNPTVLSNVSARCVTRLTAVNVAITYRIA